MTDWFTLLVAFASCVAVWAFFRWFEVDDFDL